MTKINAREGSPLIQWGAISVLGLVNLAVFHAHYFGNDCFPWDFWKAYYTIIPFWTTAVSQHVLPQWVPFAGMGYPFFINPQSSFFYPPLWFFVLPGIHYSLHAAVIMQCLHVFWGACGAFFLLRVLTNDWRSALFGALAYEFFGGFYSNAEHMDIVRAYSWLPWLFWGATVKGTLQIRNLLLPAIFYCVATASYPGNLISHSFLVGVYLLYQFYQPSARSDRRSVLVIVGLLALGVILSLVALGPAFLLRDQLTRASANLPTASLAFQDWLSLIAPWTFGTILIPGYLGDPSMISAFVGLPTIMLIVLIQKTTTKRFTVWWVLLILAGVLAFGKLSILYCGSVILLPILGFSRMASSDYRGVVGLALIVLASASFSEFLGASKEAQRKLIRTRFKYFGLLLVVIMSGVFGVFIPAQENIWIVLIWVATLVALCLQCSKLMGWPSMSAAFLCVLVLVSGWHVISVSKWTWTAGGTDVDNLYKESIGFPTYTWPLPVAEKIRGLHIRPARVDRKRGDFSWAGYLDGTYQMNDWNNLVLNARVQVETNQVLLEYMRLPLTPLVFPHAQQVSFGMIRERLAKGMPALETQREVVPAKYGLNTIAYDVTLTTEAIVVENEIWLPGWKGELIQDANTLRSIRATSVDKTLRAWRLPAGQYKFVTQYRTPYLTACAILSLIGFLTYLSLLAIAYRNWKARMRILPLSTVSEPTPVEKGSSQIAL
jgi:hypothetical protein